MSTNKNNTIEELFDRLNQIQEIISSPETSIEEASNIFNEASEISKTIQERLSKIQSKIEILVSQNQDNLEFEPYGESDSKN